MLRCIGEVVRVEQKPWKMDDGRFGVTRKARVLIGRADLLDVDVPETLPFPYDGEKVDWDIDVSVSYGKLKATLRGSWAEDVPRAAASKSA